MNWFEVATAVWVGTSAASLTLGGSMLLLSKLRMRRYKKGMDEQVDAIVERIKAGGREL